MLMECPDSDCQAGLVLDQSYVAVSKCERLMPELVQLSVNEVAPN